MKSRDTERELGNSVADQTVIGGKQVALKKQNIMMT